METRTKRNLVKQYILYLTFMLIACSGALIWQIFLPELADRFSVWGMALGWQREIALWNIGLISSIAYTLIKKKKEFMKLLTLQSTVLCWALGLNHLVALISNFSLKSTIHILGVLEVMLLGGIWGSILLIRENNKDYI
ncbi:MAG: hypothetical protein HFG36_07710 [Eubacterium sp.]|nr:hypothetical protein [Eubacterium sp.]